MISRPPANSRCLCRLLLLLLLPALFSTVGRAQAKPSKAEMRDLKREMNADAPGGKPNKRDGSSDSRDGRSNSGDAESRNLARLRDRFEVTDDAEWEVIAERINSVNELRRSVWTGGASFEDKGKRSARSGATAHPEQDALRTAVSDKLPDAEIKARLTRAHEVYRQNEILLARAQAELRAVLTVRQEAVAVMAGLLPP